MRFTSQTSSGLFDSFQDGFRLARRGLWGTASPRQLPIQGLPHFSTRPARTGTVSPPHIVSCCHVHTFQAPALSPFMMDELLGELLGQSLADGARHDQGHLSYHMHFTFCPWVSWDLDLSQRLGFRCQLQLVTQHKRLGRSRQEPAWRKLAETARTRCQLNNQHPDPAQRKSIFYGCLYQIHISVQCLAGLSFD